MPGYKFQCLFCPKRFDTKSSIRRHIRNTFPRKILKNGTGNISAIFLLKRHIQNLFCCFLSKWIYSGSTRAPSPTCVAPVVCIFPVLATQRHAEFFFISVFQMSLQNTVKYPVPIFIKIVRIGSGYGFKILLTLIRILFSHKNLFPGNKSF